MQAKKLLAVGISAIIVLGAAAFFLRGPLKIAASQVPFLKQLLAQKTVEDQIEAYGELARARLNKLFKSKKLDYPPNKLAFLAFKDKRVLEVYVASADEKFQHLSDYKILAASGKLGPKLRQGDFQVPEGLYRIEALEPNTPYHLGLRLNYPNAFDLDHARIDGREDPGGDILIHGSNGSVGCLAMGDEVAEDLFVMAHDTKSREIPVIICPVDLRSFKAPPADKNDPVWLPDLYKQLETALKNYPAH